MYRNRLKIKMSLIAMLRGKIITHKSGLGLEQMKLSNVGIYFLIIASVVRCIGATGTSIV